MGAAVIRFDQPSRRLDWRLVPAAVVAWVVTLAAMVGPWWLSLLGGVVVGGVGLVVFLGAGGRGTTTGRWVRVGVGASLLACGFGLAVPTAMRLREATDDPLREVAAHGLTGRFRVELADRPRPVMSAGFGGRQGGAQAVVVPARVNRAAVAGRSVTTSGRVLLIAPVDGWAPLLPGQEVDLDAAVEPARPPGMTVAVLRVRGPPVAVGEPAAWQRWARALRSGLREASGVLDPEPAGLLPALVVGDTDALARNVVGDFRTAGMAHLLAVSGANLAIVCVAMLLLLRALRVGPRGCAAGAMLTLIGFVILAGPEPSVLRAGVMGAVGLLAMVTGRERSALPALATTVLLLVLYDPELAINTGFALSVLATAGLVLLAPRWAERLAARGIPRGVAEALAVPAAAHLVTAPVVAGMTGQVSLVAILANVLAAPVVAPATVLGVLVAVFAHVLPWVARMLARLAGPELDWLIIVARHAARVPGAAISWPAGWLGGLLLLLLIIVLAAALRKRRLRVIAGIALALMLVVVIPLRVIMPAWPPDGWAMVACDVGQGDAVVLATADSGRAVVIDTGPEPGPVGECLDRLGVDNVPLVILSHLHADHIGGLAAVLASRQVGAVAVGPARSPGWAWQEVIGDVSRAGVPLVRLDMGQRLAWPGLTIDVLGPLPADAQPVARADGTEINNSSVVIRAVTPAGRMLLTGDVELIAQADLLNARTDLSADVLKVPHHGSRYSVPDFLDAVGARIAMVSVGAGNRYGHPSPTTLGFLTRRGTQLTRTDTDGDSAIVPGPRAVIRGHPRAPPK
jgi:competence protein ComEC